MKNKSIYCIEIGNSNIHTASFNEKGEISADERISHSEISLLPWAEIKEKHSIIVCAGEITHIKDFLIETVSDKNIKYLDLKIENQRIVKNTYPTLGIDRVCNLIGALHCKLGDSPIITFDFGTATTATACDSNGNFLGGTIAPGFEIGLASLSTKTFNLPNIELARECKILELNPLAKSTDEAMLQGVIISQVSFVNHYLKLFNEKVKAKPKIVITGGNAPIITRFFSDYDLHDPFLTLKGVYYTYLNAVSTASTAS